MASTHTGRHQPLPACLPAPVQQDSLPLLPVSESWSETLVIHLFLTGREQPCWFLLQLPPVPSKAMLLTVGACWALLERRSTMLPPWPQIEMFLCHQALHWIPLSSPASWYWLKPTPPLERRSFCSCLACVSPLPRPPFFSAGLRESPFKPFTCSVSREHPLCLLHALLALEGS